MHVDNGQQEQADELLLRTLANGVRDKRLEFSRRECSVSCVESEVFVRAPV